MLYESYSFRRSGPYSVGFASLKNYFLVASTLIFSNGELRAYFHAKLYKKIPFLTVNTHVNINHT
jgi:hypothetical protein